MFASADSPSFLDRRRSDSDEHGEDDRNAEKGWTNHGEAMGEDEDEEGMRIRLQMDSNDDSRDKGAGNNGHDDGMKQNG